VINSLKMSRLSALLYHMTDRSRNRTLTKPSLRTEKRVHTFGTANWREVLIRHRAYCRWHVKDILSTLSMPTSIRMYRTFGVACISTFVREFF